jgi:hypothetical protein
MSNLSILKASSGGDGVSGWMRSLGGLVSLVMVILMLTAPVGAAGGLVTKPSPYPVAETMDRLERAVKDRELVVIARLDHAAAAQKAGLTLRPIQLLIFGNPKAGTLLMQTASLARLQRPELAGRAARRQRSRRGRPGDDGGDRGPDRCRHQGSALTFPARRPS